MHLDELGLQIGSPVQIQYVDDESRRYTVQLVGFVRNHGLILSAGKVGDVDLGLVLRDSQPLILRFKTAKTAVAFRTHIIEKRLTPYAHIHVAIPEEIESAPMTQQQLVSCMLAVNFINDDEASHPMTASIIALGTERLMVKREGRLADAGQSISITMTCPFAGHNNVLVLDGEVELAEMLADGGQQVTVKLAGLDISDQILLQGLYYQLLLVNMKVIDR